MSQRYISRRLKTPRKSPLRPRMRHTSEGFFTNTVSSSFENVTKVGARAQGGALRQIREGIGVRRRFLGHAFVNSQTVSSYVQTLHYSVLVITRMSLQKLDTSPPAGPIHGVRRGPWEDATVREGP